MFCCQFIPLTLKHFYRKKNRSKLIFLKIKWQYDFHTPENAWKPLPLWGFQLVKIWNIGMKWLFIFLMMLLPNLTAVAMQQQSISPNLFGNRAMPWKMLWRPFWDFRCIFKKINLDPCFCCRNALKSMI